jgi:hypothetical protein
MYAASEAGQRAAEQAGYAPLPSTLRIRVTQAIATLR